MRKSQLRQQVDQYCKHNHTGSFRAKKHRHFVLHKMIRDLYHIGHVPPKWHTVTHDHMVQLVAHWQKEEIKPKTIMKYMTIIRRFFKVSAIQSIILATRIWELNALNFAPRQSYFQIIIWKY